MLRSFKIALAAITIGLGACATGVPSGGERASSPESVGLSSERLQRLTQRMQEGVAKGEYPGAVLVIGRQGKIAYSQTFGVLNPETKTPMREDGIFRIASMTKPMASLAVMMLSEEGKLSIVDPVDKYLPELKNMQVGVVKPGADGKPALTLEPQKQRMTVQDLLRHTSGLPSGEADSSNLIKRMYAEAKIGNRGFTSAQYIAALAKMPLLFQPGTTWEYGASVDVLGVIVERVSGMSLDKFIAERITGPLKMPDTGFAAPASQAHRGARPQREGPKNALPNIALITDVATFKSGGGGMVSTAADYARFSQFLLNRGELDGVRLVSPKTMDLMTANHLPPGTPIGPDMARFEALAPSAEMGQGFGLGFAVRTDAGRNPLPGSVGDYYWGGAQGTYFWIDPKEQLYVVFMMQSPAARLSYRFLLRQMVYQAVVK
jgi:CubicO group peptidase (beta-lactamase class C family)